MDFLTNTLLTRRRFLKLAAAALAAPTLLSNRTLAQGTPAKPLRIGAILPIPTGNPEITDTIGNAAQAGATMAEGLVAVEASNMNLNLKVLLASSPTVAAATRAAERLVALEGVCGFIGGVGEGQAQALSKVAQEQKVLFFNIGSTDDALREEACNRTMFHVEASAAMYLDALVAYYAASGQHRWFFVYADSDEGKALYSRAKVAVGSKQQGAQEAGSIQIASGPHAYNDVFAQLRAVKPDVVLLLLDPADQDFFLGQYEFSKLDFPITGFPTPLAQTRDFYTRFLQSAPKAGAGYRAALWEASLAANGAAELNERFLGQSGTPMDPSAWAAFMAIKILTEAVGAAGTTDSDTLVRYLESPQASFDVDKGVKVSFRPWNHQLRQPLYIVKLNPEAKLDTDPQDRLALAKVAATLPKVSGVVSTAQLDQLGISENDSQCRL